MSASKLVYPALYVPLTRTISASGDVLILKYWRSGPNRAESFNILWYWPLLRNLAVVDLFVVLRSVQQPGSYCDG